MSPLIDTLKGIDINTDLEPVLEIENLSKNFGKRLAVNNLSLSVGEGQIYGFLGPNGAGKSTTIRMIFGLINPSGGSVKLFGKLLSSSNRKILSSVGGLIESPDFYKFLSARNNLKLLGRLNKGFVESEVVDVLEKVGLSGRADDLVKTYSHGMIQRLGIAQALMNKPKLLVLDEPSTGLDPVWMKNVRELIMELASNGTAIFLSSHILSEVEQIATHVGIVSKGNLIIQDSLEKLLATSEQYVRIKCSDLNGALSIAQELKYVESAEINDEMLLVKIRARSSAELNKILVDKGIEVHSLIPQTTLEEYFLSITKGESDA